MDINRRSQSPRYDAFDGLRATLLLLFLILHASLPYVVAPLGDLWPFKDRATHIGFDLIAVLIHCFRLPLFFTLAGFFAALIYHERGPRAFLVNRWRRIALPLALAWLIVTPLMILAVPSAAHGVSPESLRIALDSLLRGDAQAPLQWYHLWFLFDLLVYYGIAMVAIPAFRLIPGKPRWAAIRAAGDLLQRPWAPLPLAIVTAATLLPMKSGMLDTPGTFQRPIPTLLADGLFVLFGWCLYLRRETIPTIGKRAWHYTILGALLFAVYVSFLTRLLGGGTTYLLPTILSLSGSLWLFVFGIMGLFARYYRRPHPTGRYLAEASYWCYLIHLPLVAWIPLFLAPLAIPPTGKFAVVFSLTIGVCLLTYQFFVRKTRLGDFLGGRRERGPGATVPSGVLGARRPKETIPFGY